ncbi:MAG TPA: hypothetical protein VKB88_21150 [Bryobacteraceae bacterium]|nr:hypothetical protein [Bryobacteraceae bacterium]
MKAVLIIDGDLGFVFWLGKLLADAGYQALPAKGFSEANALLDEMQPVGEVGTPRGRIERDVVEILTAAGSGTQLDLPKQVIATRRLKPEDGQAAILHIEF